MALTELSIKALKPKDKIYRVADSNGLCLEVRTNGAKYWRYRYRLKGKLQMASLGKYPILTLSEARKKRDEAKILINDGKNPTREKRAAKLRNIADGENTFEAIARKWLELKKSSMNEKYRTQCLTRLEQHVFPMIGVMPIAEITIPDVVRVIEKIAERGTIETAKRMKQLISQTFRYASQRGMCPHNPAADLRDILPSTPNNHHKCVSLEDVSELLKAIDNYGGERLVVLMMQFLSLTFVRTGELIGARWDEIDFDRAEWNIPAQRMKMRRPHMVPLAKQSLAILEEIKTITGTREQVFYSSRSKSKHMSNGTILMALKRMGYKGRMTGHGFRTIASTLLNEKGYKPDWIERQLAHEDQDKIRSAYNRAEYALERKKMLQDYADILEEMKLQKNNITFIVRKEETNG